MRRLIACLCISLVQVACGEKQPPPLLGGNNDDANNLNNIAAECTRDFDCFGARCVGGICVDDPPNNVATNNTTPNNTATNNASTNNTIGTNNGTIAPPVACDDTGGADRFSLWASTGVNVAVAPDANAQLEGPSGVITSGIAVADFDGDGDADVMVTNQGGRPGLFLNDGSGSFADVTTNAGLAGLTETSSVSVADFDGDGDRDAIVGRTAGGAYVLQNQGDGTFVDASATWGIGQATDAIASGSFADFDGDGDLDFYQGNYSQAPGAYPETQPNRLYRNDGNTFTEITVSPGGAGEEASTLAVAWWDFDADGRPDLWSANDFGMTAQPNQLWRNMGPDPGDPNGWRFEDISAQAGLDVAIFSMSATLGDFDNDGDQDAYVANMANNVLHVFDGGTTTNQAVQRGVTSGVLPDPRPRPLQPPSYFALIPEMQAFLDTYADASSGMYTLTSWSSIFFDADQDGWQDLYVSNGAVITGLTPEATNQPNYLFMNQGDGTFDRDPCYAIPDVRGSTRGAAIGDLDGDGDMDLLWSDNGVNGTPGVVVSRNDLAAGNWVTIELRGQSPNTDAIGAKVTLQAGGVTQTRWIDGGQSFMSVSERVAHFGIGSAGAVDSVRVSWPDGSTQMVAVPAVNQRLVVQQ